MKWLMNIYDPRRKEAAGYLLARPSDEARNRKQIETLLQGRVIGDPRQAHPCGPTAEELRRLGMVGIYSQSQESDNG